MIPLNLANNSTWSSLFLLFVTKINLVKCNFNAVHSNKRFDVGQISCNYINMLKVLGTSPRHARRRTVTVQCYHTIARRSAGVITVVMNTITFYRFSIITKFTNRMIVSKFGKIQTIRAMTFIGTILTIVRAVAMFWCGDAVAIATFEVIRTTS